VEVLKKLLAHQQVVVQLAATIALIVLAASMSHYFMERPFLRLKARFKRTGDAP
jgi:peptidoglycan/LPS O-acetylase OafA/YrhL